VIAAALDEAMSLLLHGQGTYALTGRLEVELKAPAAVGTFVEIQADVQEAGPRTISVTASADGDAGPVASGTAVFVRQR
jgi:acyl-coenzyme A thioesterase PaaI-like protein